MADEVLTRFKEILRQTLEDIGRLKEGVDSQIELDALVSGMRNRIDEGNKLLKTMEQLQVEDGLDLAQQISINKAELHRLTVLTREVNLLAFKRLKHKALSGAREQLLTGANLTAEVGNIRTAREITAGLHRTNVLMSNEIDRMVEVNKTLASSTQTLKSTSTEYATYGSVLSRASNLLSLLKRKDVIDNLMIFGSFIFFLCVVAFILFRRTPGSATLLSLFGLAFSTLTGYTSGDQQSQDAAASNLVDAVTNITNSDSTVLHSDL
eukprot:GILK01008367.1.p1 GENE.GILK01008367.1~~GILK01008367.1.p1  ORF type:complete len:266 (-),score=39.14 GILK01008367.1:54-851(-)